MSERVHMARGVRVHVDIQWYQVRFVSFVVGWGGSEDAGAGFEGVSTVPSKNSYATTVNRE